MLSLVRSSIFALWLLLPAVAWAEDPPASLPAVGDALFKGVVGKALDAVPMDPDHRLALQRGNAVVSNTLTGRSIAVWAGLANPLLLIGGVVWGLFSASNIKPKEARPAPVTIVVDTETWGPKLGNLEPYRAPLQPDQQW